MRTDTVSPADKAVIATLQAETLTTLSALLPADVARVGVALIDFPTHQNVGDSMIWEGERRYLKMLGAPIRYVADYSSFRRRHLDTLDPAVPLLLHGGGNLGDLWPEFQKFREHVVDTARDRKIIQLPQSIWFASDEAALRAGKCFASHPDLTVLVREHQSLEMAERSFRGTSTVFCHDMALGIGPLIRTTRPEAGRVVRLLRQDLEAVAHDAAAAQGESVDWGLDGMADRLWQTARYPTRVPQRVPSVVNRGLSPAVVGSFNLLARINLLAGVRLFSPAERVVTDRLHAHVLASLLGIPHVALDNNYGKVAAVMAASTGGLSSVQSGEL